MQEAIETLRRVSPDVIIAAIVGLDGEIEAVSGQGELDDVVGPTMTTFGTIAARVVQELGRGALQRSILQGSYGNIVAEDVGDGRVLVVVAEPAARLGLLIDDVTACVGQLGREVAHV